MISTDLIWVTDQVRLFLAVGYDSDIVFLSSSYGALLKMMNKRSGAYEVWFVI